MSVVSDAVSIATEDEREHAKTFCWVEVDIQFYSRAWIFQEFVLSTLAVLFSYCGVHVIDGEHVAGRDDVEGVMLLSASACSVT